jgi:hypothetical protein
MAPLQQLDHSIKPPRAFVYFIKNLLTSEVIPSPIKLNYRNPFKSVFDEGEDYRYEHRGWRVSPSFLRKLTDKNQASLSQNPQLIPFPGLKNNG